MTIKEVAGELGCHQNTIRKHMERLGIDRRGPRDHNPDRFDIDEDDLRRLYHDDGMTQGEIADHYGCSNKTVSSRMARYGIQTRTRAHNRNLHPAAYWDQNGYLVAQCSTEQKRVGVHQLVAIADGADPHEVFSGGDSVTHHINEHKGDNRPSNLLVTDPGMHENIHNAEWLFREGTDEEIEALVSLLEQKGYTDRLVGAAGRAGSPAT